MKESTGNVHGDDVVILEGVDHSQSEQGVVVNSGRSGFFFSYVLTLRASVGAGTSLNFSISFFGKKHERREGLSFLVSRETGGVDRCESVEDVELIQFFRDGSLSEVPKFFEAFVEPIALFGR